MKKEDILMLRNIEGDHFCVSVAGTRLCRGFDTYEEARTFAIDLLEKAEVKDNDVIWVK